MNKPSKIRHPYNPPHKYPLHPSHSTLRDPVPKAEYILIEAFITPPTIPEIPPPITIPIIPIPPNNIDPNVPI